MSAPTDADNASFTLSRKPPLISFARIIPLFRLQTQESKTPNWGIAIRQHHYLHIFKNVKVNIILR